MKYRIVFSGGPSSDIRKHYDVDTKDSDEAFKKAFQMPEAKSRLYSDVSVEDIPTGVSNIGICFCYEERGKSYHQYMVIHAESERHAKDWYNANLKGKRFYQPWPHKPDENGNCVYGKIAETYFAACPGYDFDATK